MELSPRPRATLCGHAYNTLRELCESCDDSFFWPCPLIKPRPRSPFPDWMVLGGTCQLRLGRRALPMTYPAHVEILGDSAEFEVLADLFRHLVVEIARLPEPTPPITAEMPAGRALLALIDQGWSTLDKGLTPDETVARATGSLAMAAADLCVKLAFLAAKARAGDDGDPVTSDAIEVLEDAVCYMDEQGSQIADLPE